MISAVQKMALRRRMRSLRNEVKSGIIKGEQENPNYVCSRDAAAEPIPPTPSNPKTGIAGDPGFLGPTRPLMITPSRAKPARAGDPDSRAGSLTDPRNDNSAVSHH